MTVEPDDPPKAVDLLAHRTGLSKSRIKHAMNKGAVWWIRPGRKRQRLRRADQNVKCGQSLEIFYDPKILSQPDAQAVCLDDQKKYNVWVKPAGVTTQGTNYGDHCALLGHVEMAFRPQRQSFPVHRLDREAAGINLIGHSKNAATALSTLFQQRRVKKGYRVQVRGALHQDKVGGLIELPLDGKKSLTEFRTIFYNREANITDLEVFIHTGRKHQIRRHLPMIGHPVMGDPRYGKGNKNRSGLKLAATILEFECPYRKRGISYSIGPNTFDKEPLLRKQFEWI